VLAVVDGGVVFKRLQMRDDFCGCPQFSGQSLFEHCGQAVGFTYRRLGREQKMYLNDLAIAGGSETNAVILNVQI
jgi:hypothetical protein